MRLHSHVAGVIKAAVEKQATVCVGPRPAWRWELVATSYYDLACILFSSSRRFTYLTKQWIISCVWELPLCLLVNEIISRYGGHNVSFLIFTADYELPIHRKLLLSNECRTSPTMPNKSTHYASPLKIITRNTFQNSFVSSCLDTVSPPQKNRTRTSATVWSTAVARFH